MSFEKHHSAASKQPDHGGNLDAACARFGGAREEWIDLSTGINPVPYPLPSLRAEAWTALPDAKAAEGLVDLARAFWAVPKHLDILPTHGASAPIARMPHMFEGNRVCIPEPTYNEHGRAFAAAGWSRTEHAAEADAVVLVHPNNPDGRLWSRDDLGAQVQGVVDESFADCLPGASLLPTLSGDRQVVLKSFGKFWGLAGLRLGFVIGAPKMITPLREALGPWSVSGPALAIGAAALADEDWARETRARLAEDAQRLDALMMARGVRCLGGTPLFRLYEAEEASAFQEGLARHHIWSRIFPYSDRWVRLGLPAPHQWDRVAAALA